MHEITIRRRIDAPLDLVFRTVAEIDNFRRAVPHIVDVEFLGDQRVGVGTRFRETRRVGSHEATTELEVTEYETDRHVRLVADSHGTVWDSIFRVRQVGGQCELEMVMEARPHQLVAKLTVPMAMKSVAKTIEKDLDAVQSYCETVAAGA